MCHSHQLHKCVSRRDLSRVALALERIAWNRSAARPEASSPNQPAPKPELRALARVVINLFPM